MQVIELLWIYKRNGNKLHRKSTGSGREQMQLAMYILASGMESTWSNWIKTKKRKQNACMCGSASLVWETRESELHCLVISLASRLVYFSCILGECVWTDSRLTCTKLVWILARLQAFSHPLVQSRLGLKTRLYTTNTAPSRFVQID